MSIDQKAPQKLVTQVQTLETNHLPTVSKNFRIYSTGNQHEELQASRELYDRIGQTTGCEKTEDFDNCRRFAWFSVSHTTRKVRVASNSCRLRWCPLCSQALTRYRTHAIAEWLEGAGTSRFLTLTLKHTDEDLSIQIKNLYYYFIQLRKIKYFKQVVTGGIWFFQVKRSAKSGEWHPHLHCLVTGSYIIHPKLSEIWCRITGGSTVVDIRSITDTDSISKYVSRYSSRPATLNEYSISDRVEIYSVLHGKRLCGKWGTGKECSLQPSNKIDMSEWRRIGKWSTVIHHAPFMAYARVVFKCWKQDRPIPGFIDLSCLELPETRLQNDHITDAVLLTYFEGDIA